MGIRFSLPPLIEIPSPLLSSLSTRTTLLSADKLSGTWEQLVELLAVSEFEVEVGVLRPGVSAAVSGENKDKVSPCSSALISSHRSRRNSCSGPRRFSDPFLQTPPPFMVVVVLRSVRNLVSYPERRYALACVCATICAYVSVCMCDYVCEREPVRVYIYWTRVS